MKKEIKAIRGINEETYRKFREKVVAKRMKVGEALTQAMKEWVRNKEERKIDPRNLLKIKPIKVGKKKVRWSEEVDEFLYGLKK